ncbi:DNA mismatch repair endonuclease MutL [Lactobacillus sp. 3B(2020)]|uniref:DNA mismatch repair endonuclease MutL n=1 Tax=Lactobacillus sp. 3B(2020) TaxID=2695882 RepID=UPI0015E02DBB|nr:DNA mismatch repair endonuclease MutL [Lactobacillus sp. 3B(2020)]QLL69489.1 DNA mismatch repair endonuclease MutL [Lactobacillus sp. 3B(2020)]
MAEIRELPTVLANQIAAGEVIERPASVVKELVENAIDAHSRRIDILIQEAGLAEIRVIDDGDGIEKSQVPIAFKRHATSKINSKLQLFKVTTMGFRGEALPSIASVADLKLITTVAGADGYLYHVKGGKVVEEGPAASRPGTDVTVSQLFYNTPARLKYLKSPKTELGHIVDIVYRLALGNPTIAISLSNNGKELFRSAGNGNLHQVIAAIYGVQVARKMVAIAGADDDFRVSGYVSLPELTRSSGKYQTLLINHRYIRNFTLNKAIIAGYGSKLMVGRYPFAVLEIELDPALVDVNVHPAKREVRLSKEEQLSALIAKAIYERLAKENLIPDVGKTAQKLVAAKQVMPTQTAVQETQVTYQENLTPPKEAQQQNPAAADGNDSEVAAPIIIHQISDLESPVVAAFDQRYRAEGTMPPFAGLGVTKKETSVPQPEQVSLPIEDTGEPAQKRFPDLTYIGQLQGTFLLAQASDGLYILDQHAAQERVNYERFRKEIGEVSADQQSFLTPLVLNYSLTDALMIRRHLEVLAGAGLHLSTFGQNSFLIQEHPTWFVAGQEEATIREMIDWVLKDGRITVASFREKTAIMMSCKRAIKANHHLDQREAVALLKRLPSCENPFNCPHGRPVLIHLTDRDLEKMFKRIQDSHQPYAGEFDDHEF